MNAVHPMELRKTPMPPREARRLPKLASKIVKVAEFNGLRALFLVPYPTRYPQILFLIAAAPHPSNFWKPRTLTVSSDGPHFKWPKKKGHTQIAFWSPKKTSKMALSLRYPPAGPGRAVSEFDFLDIILATAALRASSDERTEINKWYIGLGSPCGPRSKFCSKMTFKKQPIAPIHFAH